MAMAVAMRTGFVKRTIDGIADALRACRSDRDFYKMHRWAAGILTPLEAAALIEFSHRLPPQTQTWVQSIALSGNFSHTAPQRYCRQPLAENIDVYTDPFVSTAQKSLIVAFCGAANGMMISTPAFLQYLPSGRYDIVLLRDPTKLYYVFAIPPYAQTLPDLAQRLAADLGAKNYRRIYCFGASMGGFPALRFGILLRAETAISAGGGFLRYPARGQEFDIPAFDLLCGCNAETPTTLICCYSTGLERDALSVEVLARTFRVQRMPVVAAQHNFFNVLWQEGKLKTFLAGLFGSESAEQTKEQRAAVQFP